MRVRWLLLLALLPWLAACGPKAPQIVIENPWARSSPRMAETGVVYMVIRNKGSAPDVLIGASTDIAEAIEIHESIMENGVMKMQPVPGQRLEIPAQGAVELKPGGYHLMLLKLKQPLQEGQTITVTLRFEKSGEITVQVPVKRMGP